MKGGALMQETINERVKAIRKSLKLSQDEFGKRLGVSRGVITNIEFNKTEPKPLFIDLLCREFNVDENWLRTGEGEMFLQLDEDAELDLIFTEIELSDDDIIKQIIKSYWKLPEDKKATVKEFIQGIAAEQIKKQNKKSPE